MMVVQHLVKQAHGGQIVSETKYHITISEISENFFCWSFFLVCVSRHFCSPPLLHLILSFFEKLENHVILSVFLFLTLFFLCVLKKPQIQITCMLTNTPLFSVLTLQLTARYTLVSNIAR